MKRPLGKISLFAAALCFGVLGACGTGLSGQGFTSADADAAFETFNKHYYNPELGVYQTSIENGKRAAIWTQAVFWDMAMNAYERTGEQKHLDLIEDMYRGAAKQYSDYDWNDTIEWFIYDDIMWWVISMGRAYELTGQQKYLDHSISGFRRVWEGTPEVNDNGSYDPEEGGMRWGWKPNQRGGKMACINFPTVVGAMTLHNITGRQEYLDKALEIYTWARGVLFDPRDGRIADHKNRNHPANWKTHLYNQATFIGAGVMLYKKTGERHYLDDAILAADHVRNVMSDDEGMLPVENGIEQGIYAAIFAQYIIRLIEDCGQEQYLPWLRDNINRGWENRDRQRGLTYKVFGRPCPEGDIEVYDASACVALMQVVPPEAEK